MLGALTWGYKFGITKTHTKVDLSGRGTDIRGLSEFNTMAREDPRLMIIELGSIHASQRVYISVSKSKLDCKQENIQVRHAIPA
jgi:hypothetical protein